jgi:hypothetical protein
LIIIHKGEVTMKQYVLGCVALAVTAATATAQERDPEANNPLITFAGAASILSLSPQCSTTGFVVGDYLKSVYRPRLVGDEPVSALTFFASRSGGIFRRVSGGSDKMNGAGTYEGGWTTTRATSSLTNGTFNFTITPPNPTEATTFVNIQGTITNFGMIAGCTMRFRGGYARRPN